MLDFFSSLPIHAAADKHAACCAQLDDFTVFSASGDDAAAFLHSQLTHDTLALNDTNARYAGYCTPKGRLLSTLVIWREAGVEPAALSGFMRADGAEAIVKRLRMFVLRAKVKFDFSERAVAGVSAPIESLPALSAAAGAALPTQSWSRVDSATGTWIAAPSTGKLLRWWWVFAPASLESAASALRPLLSRMATSSWHAQELAAGLPWVGADTQDLFIPQTVNLDLVDGVSFTKGCYPGQEIVARSHYRGTVKRRMSYGVLDAGASPETVRLRGTDIYDADQPGEPCGRVVDAAHSADLSILFETTFGALENDQLRLGAADGPRIKIVDLPYSLEH